MSSEPKFAILPGVYRHYKGGLYRVLHPRVINEATEEAGVVYVSLTAHDPACTGECNHPNSFHASTGCQEDWCNCQTPKVTIEQHRLTWRRILGDDGWLEPLPDGRKRFELVEEG